MGELVIRLVFSLAVVVGLLILLSRVVGRRFGSSSRSVVKVLHRQALSRTTSVAVVSVGSRVLVLGTTEHQVSLLTELSPGEVAQAEERSGAAVEDERPDTGPDFDRELQDALAGDVHPRRSASPALAGSRLAGSLLAPQTWRDAITATRGRTS